MANIKDVSINISDKMILVVPEELIPYHNNLKEHSAEQIDKIASSIKNFGFTQPIVIDVENEVIIGYVDWQQLRNSA